MSGTESNQRPGDPGRQTAAPRSPKAGPSRLLPGKVRSGTATFPPKPFSSTNPRSKSLRSKTEEQASAWKGKARPARWSWRLAGGRHTDRSPGTPGRAKRPQPRQSRHEDSRLLGAACLWAPPPHSGRKGTAAAPPHRPQEITEGKV